MKRSLKTAALSICFLSVLGCFAQEIIESTTADLKPPLEGSTIEILNVFYVFNKDLSDNSPPKIEIVIFYLENASVRDGKTLYDWTRRFFPSFLEVINDGGCHILEKGPTSVLSEPDLRIRQCMHYPKSFMIEMSGKAPLREYKRYLDALMKEFSIPIISAAAKKQYLRLGSDL